MVRLKALFNNAAPYNLMLFQFQNGTIKRGILSAENTAIPQFQFQNGTIKRTKSLRINTKVRLFQFQNGTIKS